MKKDDSLINFINLVNKDQYELMQSLGCDVVEEEMRPFKEFYKTARRAVSYHNKPTEETLQFHYHQCNQWIDLINDTIICDNRFEEHPDLKKEFHEKLIPFRGVLEQLAKAIESKLALRKGYNISNLEPLSESQRKSEKGNKNLPEVNPEDYFNENGIQLIEAILKSYRKISYVDVVALFFAFRHKIKGLNKQLFFDSG